MQYIAIIILCLMALGLACIALTDRKRAPEIRNCPCEGCKILRGRPMPKAKAVRDRLAEAHRREFEEARNA